MSKFNIPHSEFHFTFSRSSGAGGQNINKVNTKVTLHWNARLTTCLPEAVQQRFITKYSNKLNDEGEITLSSQAHRTQHMNITDVIKKLYKMIESVALAPIVRKPTKPTISSVRKRVDEKKQHGEKKKNRQEKF